MTKFHIGFDISGEGLSKLVAKMVPIENLTIMELRSIVASRTRVLQMKEPLLEPRLIHRPQRNKRKSSGPNLKKGINGIIMVELKDGPKRPIDLGLKVKAAGYAINSTNSRLEELRKAGVVESTGDGTWRLKL